MDLTHYLVKQHLSQGQRPLLYPGADKPIHQAAKPPIDAWAERWILDARNKGKVVEFKPANANAALAAAQEVRRKRPLPTSLPVGNLPWTDYRFWIGSALEGVSRMAICRHCLRAVFTGWERKCHMEYTKCSVLLVGAYKRLLLYPMCVMCDKETFGKQKWGVPLCSADCVRDWMFRHTRTDALRTAIDCEKHLSKWLPENEKYNFDSWDVFKRTFKTGGF